MLEGIAGSFHHGLEVLATLHTDSRTAPPGFAVSRQQIFRDFCVGLRERELPLEPSPACCALLQAFRAEVEEARAEAKDSGDGQVVEAGAAAPSDDKDASGADEGAAEDVDEEAAELARWLCAAYTSQVHARLSSRESSAEVRGAGALLEALAAHGVPCYINSATPTPPLVQVVEALGWSRYFRQVLGGGGADDKRRNLEAIARAEGLGATQLVHVGDGDNDCRAAAAFGCRFVGVVTGRADAALPAAGSAGKRKRGDATRDATSCFSGPTCGVVSDMVEAGVVLAELLDVRLDLRLRDVRLERLDVRLDARPSSVSQDAVQDDGQDMGQGQGLRPSARGRD